MIKSQQVTSTYCDWRSHAEPYAGDAGNRTEGQEGGGGGTGLATQRECLELLGCYGSGKVRKFAEICAAVVLAGDISLSSAVLHGDWVTSHDRLGRNRP